MSSGLNCLQSNMGTCSSSDSKSSGSPTTVNNMDLLPDEVLSIIFSLLSVKDILVCEKVSRRWRRLARDPYIWRHNVVIYNCRFQHQNYRERFLDMIKSHGECISRIKVQYVHEYTTLKAILTNCHTNNLISLDLDMCRIFKDFEDDLKVWKNLRRISLKNCIIYKGDGDISIPYAQYKDLTFLELPEFGLTRKNCDSLISLKHLSHIHIDKIKDLPSSFILQIIYTKANILKSFHIYGEHQINDDSLRILSEECPNLTSLSIKFCNHLTDRGLYSVINLKKLKGLKIWNNVVFTEKCLLKVLGDPVMFDLNRLNISKIANITPPIIDIIHKNYTSLSFLALYSCPRIPKNMDFEDRLKERFKDLYVLFC